ncbi:family 2 glycosyl transferase [[Clostridium] sordellii]|uniref:glycosyltransferase family 2 protein n=1 Tax=Paraclostridium sordellii TaxID=1505 RepID=UPI0005DEA632|nr:glycosyltransferase family 2 protein [Paeniclostridium sordellii]CEN23759.1 family 2 glycosyl transferase [[Clostridium] sordellii] [Paeniclostridium sordellii]
MVKNTIAIIITYNPDIPRLKRNILSIYKKVNFILIVDNGSLNEEYIENLMSKEIESKNFEIIKNKENLGIASALNQGIRYAYDKNYIWALTLDQDSIVDEGMMDTYYKYIYECNNLKDIVILSPSIIDENINTPFKVETYEEEVSMVITSGSLTNVDITLKLGGFKEHLFIDSVDFEFCLNAKSKGYRVIRINEARLFHQLGNIKIHKLFGKNLITTNHSKLRRYYYFRNKIYIWKRYFHIFPKIIFRNIFSAIKTIFLIIIFEKDRSSKLKYSIIGIRDGLNNKYGKLEID